MVCPKWSYINGHYTWMVFVLDQFPISKEQGDPDGENHISAKIHHNNVILAAFANKGKKQTNHQPHEV